jgi:hypothetical protein
MNTARRELKRLTVMAGMVLGAIGSSGAVTPANALTFNFSSGTGIGTDQLRGFQEAGGLWSTWYTDPVTVNINIEFIPLDLSSLGSATSSAQFFDYSNGSGNSVYGQLNADKTSADDLIAVNNLANGAYRKLTNFTSDNPNGAGSTTPYVTTGNTIAMTTANAKALRLIAAHDTAIDATIRLNSSATWSYGTTIAPGSYDFVGVAAHEIGHALGFNSAVDALDPSGGSKPSSDYSLVPLDLFRYSDDSKAANAVDFTVGTAEKYFSIDGRTPITPFSTGVSKGDGYQAQHWQEVSSSLGIMDPATAAGELVKFTISDIRAFDVIGWDRSAASYAEFTAVPEPEQYLGTLILVAFGARTIVKYRKKVNAEIAVSTDSQE